jgi:hypothetical protein
VWLVQSHGLPGAAAAWTLRALFDTVALSWLLRASRRGSPHSSRAQSDNALVR